MEGVREMGVRRGQKGRLGSTRPSKASREEAAGVKEGSSSGSSASGS